MGLGRTRKESRQIVDHKHVLVNGKCVNIPSFQVKVGDVIEIKEKHKSAQRYKTSWRLPAAVWFPHGWRLTRRICAALLRRLPTRDEIDVPVNEMLIVELYSK